MPLVSDGFRWFQMVGKEAEAPTGRRISFLPKIIMLRVTGSEAPFRSAVGARRRVPNGEREVHARKRGGRVTVRARIGVRLGRMLDALCRARKEVSDGFRWFQMVATGFKRFQMVSDGFRWFQMVGKEAEAPTGRRNISCEDLNLC